MRLNDRLFVLPASDAAKIERRKARLEPTVQALIERAGTALERGQLSTVQALLARALQMAPEQPDVLRLYGLLLARFGNPQAAAMNFEQAMRVAPDDAFNYWQYAQVCEEIGDIKVAERLRRDAVERIPDSPLAWSDLGEHLFEYVGIEASLAPLERAARLTQDYAPVHLKLGMALVACGRAEEGAAEIRKALGIEPAFGAAWLSLVDIKTIPITVGETAKMRTLLQGPDLDESERTAIEFALARVLESEGCYREAFDLFVEANARRKREQAAWSAEHFLGQQSRFEHAFANLQFAVDDSEFGNEVIFIVGLPRSGTTLLERMLSSHSRVRAAGELNDIAQVLTEESGRLQQHYPDWVGQANADDWRRLGQRYLDLTRRWRAPGGCFTDKLPDNWRVLGAIRAMLPGAHIVISRRDPLENCWSCFKQYFHKGWEFTNDMRDLVQFWRVFDREASDWAKRAPSRVREQGHEALLANPEMEVRNLLAFCGLPFEDACLRFHESQGSVKTFSAAQVRQPLRKSTARAIHYGQLLDPWRDALVLKESIASVVTMHGSNRKSFS